MNNVIPIRTPATRVKRQALIDEFGQLQRAVDHFKPTKDRHEQLRNQIASWYDNERADQPFLEEGGTTPSRYRSVPIPA